jgi:ferredoxin--NADP+ reductase
MAETVETSLVVRAIGYRGTAVEALPFDEVSRTLSRLRPCHRSADGDSVVGVYCSGWIKRAATGMIGTNKTDSAERDPVTSNTVAPVSPAVGERRHIDP